MLGLYGRQPSALKKTHTTTFRTFTFVVRL
jgi:hypothetical protein